IQEAFDGILREIKVPGISWMFRLVGVWSRLNPIGVYPGDELGHEVAKAMQTPGESRDRVTHGIYLSDNPDDALGRYEYAFKLINEAAPVYSKMHRAVKAREIPKATVTENLTPAL